MRSAPRSTPSRALVEHGDGERDGEQRRHTERDRGPRRARLADPESDEEVRETGCDRAGEEEREQAVERHPPLDRSGDAEDAERRDLHEERANCGGHERRDEREAHGDGHRPEERRGNEREGDGVH